MRVKKKSTNQCFQTTASRGINAAQKYILHAGLVSDMRMGLGVKDLLAAGLAILNAEIWQYNLKQPNADGKLRRRKILASVTPNLGHLPLLGVEPVGSYGQVV